MTPNCHLFAQDGQRLLAALQAAGGGELPPDREGHPG